MENFIVMGHWESQVVTAVANDVGPTVEKTASIA
jgi:hypothetical protein